MAGFHRLVQDVRLQALLPEEKAPGRALSQLAMLENRTTTQNPQIGL
jgi:hypothetical protein